jgi:ferritin-like metal-binding protein YciE
VSSVPGKAPAPKLPPQVESARDLLLDELGKLLTIEETLAKRVLPTLVRELQDTELKQAVSSHLEETKGHADRIRGAFVALEAMPTGKPAPALDGLVEERSKAVEETVPALRANVNCAAAMGTEHYEINAYEAAIRLADALGAEEVGGLLRANLEEEVGALEKLGAQADRLAKLAVDERAAA